MAWLVARFINRPVQALRAAMARVATGDLSVQAPVRSADELGELNAHFNAMVDDLRDRRAHARDLRPLREPGGRARRARARRRARRRDRARDRRCSSTCAASPPCPSASTPARVVEVLTEYYALVERVCEREGGVITQFLGDGVVVVFGGRCSRSPHHARAAVRAAIALQRALARAERRHHAASRSRPASASAPAT